MMDNTKLHSKERIPFRKMIDQVRSIIAATMETYLRNGLSKEDREEMASIRFTLGPVLARLKNARGTKGWSYDLILSRTRNHYKTHLAADPLLDPFLVRAVKTLDNIINVKVKTLCKSLCFDYFKLSKEGVVCKELPTQPSKQE
jgi:hypothetical protein